MLRTQLNNKILFIGLLVLLLCLNVQSVFAATYYMPDDYSNLQSAFSSIKSGDILIIKDGIYTGSTNQITHDNLPPSGTSDNYTIIKAENDGKVLFDGEYARQMFYFHSEGGAYIQFEGIIWAKSNGSENAMRISDYNNVSPHHIKFLKCGAYDAGKFDGDTATRGDAWSISDGEYILLENCFVYGHFRYGFYVAEGSQNIVLRQCISRQDSCNTETGAAAFMTYDARNVELQNCIAIDADNNASYYLRNNAPEEPIGFYFRDTAEGYDMSNIQMRGSIALNQANGSPCYGTSGGTPDVTITNSVFWDSYWGARFRVGGISLNHCTVGEVNGAASTTTHGLYLETGNDPVTNTIVFGVDNEEAARGNGYSAGNYNCFFNNSAGNFIGWTPGANTFCSEKGNAIDPLSGSLKYLVRIEDGSNLDAKASDGGDVGATILKQIGVRGTFWGETGYNKTTSENLWPFPYENLVRSSMNAYNLSGINGARGFCSAGQNLTTYIWEYLGNETPTDITGSPESPALKPPSGLNIINN